MQVQFRLEIAEHSQIPDGHSTANHQVHALHHVLRRPLSDSGLPRSIYTI